MTLHVAQLTHADTAVRELALLELSKKREEFSDLAPMLWHSFGTVAALLQEVIAIYPCLSPPALTAAASNRVCNTLALLQCIASHQETRPLFLAAHIPLYLYPFLNTASRNKPFEYLRLTSLGVIGALIKVGGEGARGVWDARGAQSGWEVTERAAAGAHVVEMRVVTSGSGEVAYHLGRDVGVRHVTAGWCSTKDGVGALGLWHGSLVALRTTCAAALRRGTLHTISTFHTLSTHAAVSLAAASPRPAKTALPLEQRSGSSSTPLQLPPHPPHPLPSTQIDDTEVVNFLLQTEIIPLCLRIMETGSELSKTVATFIMQKILIDDVGLNYICATAERFFAVSTVLANMVVMLVEQPSHRLLKHTIRCYLRLADNLRAREALRTCLPETLKDAPTFAATLKTDPVALRWLQQLLRAVFPDSPPLILA